MESHILCKDGIISIIIVTVSLLFKESLLVTVHIPLIEQAT